MPVIGAANGVSDATFGSANGGGTATLAPDAGTANSATRNDGPAPVDAPPPAPETRAPDA